MGWLDKIFSKGKKKNTNLNLNVSMKGYEPTFSAFGNNILQSDIIYSALKMKARYFGILKPEYIRESDTETIKVRDSSVARILRRPNDFQTLYDFLTQSYFMLDKDNNCFIYPDYRIDDNNQKIYTGMYILLPIGTPVIMQDESAKLWIRFQFVNPSREVVFPYEDIIHWRSNIEDNQFLGGGRYAGLSNNDLLSSLSVYHTAKEAVAEASKLSCGFDGIIKVNSYVADNEKTQRIRDEFISDLKSNKSGIGVLDNGADYQNIQRSLKMVDSATLAEIKQNVVLHTGVTIDMLSGKMTKEERETFYENWIRPRAVSLAQAMERVFFSQWQISHGDRIVIYPTDIELMTSEERFKYCDMLLKAGAITINEARRMCGLPPVEDGNQRPRGYNNLDGGEGGSPEPNPIEEQKSKHEVNINFRFNDKHDPDSGQFAPKNGGGSGGSGKGSGGKGGSGKGSKNETTGSSGGDRGEYASQVDDEADKIKKQMSNEIKPFKEEKEVNMKDVKDRGNISDEQAQHCVEVANGVYKEASLREPQITDDVVSATAGVGGTMDGLDFRKKQVTSTAGKLGQDAMEMLNEGKASSFEEAVKKSSNLNDAVRYTSILDEDNFTSGYFAIKSNLEAKGYKEVRCKNFYDGFENGAQCQKAVQCVYQDKNGYKFELQFHTASSQGAKMGLNHKRYEKFRLNTTSKEEKNRLWNEMREIGKAVKNPEGVMKIKSHSEL